jgi:peptide alpha-N-acetyltransferase
VRRALPLFPSNRFDRMADSAGVVGESGVSTVESAEDISRKQKKRQKAKAKRRAAKGDDGIDEPDEDCDPAPPPPLPPSAKEEEVVGSSNADDDDDVYFVDYVDENQLAPIMALVDRDLSEPYSIFTYRYFVHHWPELCVLALSRRDPSVLVGVAISKAEREPESWPSPGSGGYAAEQARRAAAGEAAEEAGADGPLVTRGYVAMLAVETRWRRAGIGARLVHASIERMRDVSRCDEVVLETEVTNGGALRLYERLGFVREERLLRYYLNGVDAFRLKLWFDPPPGAQADADDEGSLESS